MRISTSILTASVLAATAVTASANSYRSEISASGGSSEIDYSNPLVSRKTDYGSAFGTYYFSDVTTRNHPLAEAAFLERNSGVSASYSRSTSRYTGMRIGFFHNGEPVAVDDGVRDTTSMIGSLDVELFIPNSILYIGGGIGKSGTKTRDSFTLEEELFSYSDSYTRTLWNFRAGVTPLDGLLIWSNFYRSQDLDDEWNVNAKYVMKLGGKALNLEASYNYFYGNDILMFAADFYFDRTFSLGVTYTYHEDFYLNDDYGLRARKFFTDEFALEASFVTSDNEDSYFIGATVRF